MTHEPFEHISSPTAAIIDRLASMHGFKRPADEPDPRPLPEPLSVEAAMGAMVEASMTLLADTALEDELDEVLWSIVNYLPSQGGPTSTSSLATMRANKRELQRAQDGSEVKSGRT